MAFKFPFTNYHELNLTWVLDQLKKLFEESAENVSVIETYNGRLTAVETELPAVSENASEASRTATAAASLAQTAKATADTAQENAIQAQGLAGQARQEAQTAQRAADAATQAAQQAQATAQNFDGRITEAQNNASQALEASRSFENRVQAAITTANNAAQTATNAQGIATRADQNAALALDTLNAQRSELERIGAEQVELITEETESGKTEIENLAQSVLDSIPSDYTALSNLVDKKAPVIINSASGAIASFSDGANNMQIQELICTIEPVQAGTGDPSPENVRPISGHTGMTVTRIGKNRWDGSVSFVQGTFNQAANYWGGFLPSTTRIRTLPFKFLAGTFTISNTSGFDIVMYFYDLDGTGRDVETYWGWASSPRTVVIPENCMIAIGLKKSDNATITPDELTGFQIELGSTATDYAPYTGNQISVTFPSSAGTVYGARMTLNPDRTGTLVVDRAKIVFDGSKEVGTANWRPNSTSIGWLYRPEITPGLKNVVSAQILSDKLKSVSYYDIYSNTIPSVAIVGQGNWGLAMRVNDTTLTTSDMINAWLDQNPVTVIYPLAEPQTFQLTAEQVSGILTTLYGTNNIWADTGDVEVTYPADTKLYIDGKFAELQATILENI